jgi:hypothetical protein
MAASVNATIAHERETKPYSLGDAAECAKTSSRLAASYEASCRSMRATTPRAADRAAVESLSLRMSTTILPPKPVSNGR